MAVFAAAGSGDEEMNGGGVDGGCGLNNAWTWIGVVEECGVKGLVDTNGAWEGVAGVDESNRGDE